MRRPLALAGALLVAAGIGLLAGRLLFGREGRVPEAAPPLGAPPGASPAKLALRWVEHGAPPPKGAGRDLTEKEKGPLIAALHAYLDVDDAMAPVKRLELLKMLTSLRAQGCEAMAHLDTFTALLYAARHFDAPLDATMPGVAGSAARGVSLRLPSGYPSDPETGPPFPFVVVLHEPARPPGRLRGGPNEGELALMERFPADAGNAALPGAILYAPTSATGKFTRDGAIDPDRVWLTYVWRSYQVDFDRTVIDGGSEALLFAAAHAIYYAGVIVRGDEADVDPELVRNFAHLRVYVVGTERSAALRSLLAGGMPPENVRVGDAAGIAPWLAGVRRRTPLAFSWVVKDKNAQRLAHWVNLDELDAGIAVPILRAEALDTEADPNTVRIESTGVRGVSLFLNDRIVDLSRPLRIVANGREMTDVRHATGRPGGKPVTLPAVLPRNADVMLDASKELSVRRSRYYGFLFPVIVDGLKNLGDADPNAPRVPASVAAGDPQREAEAEQYLEAGRKAVKGGDVEKGRRLLRKTIDLGETPSLPEARSLLESLEGR